MPAPVSVQADRISPTRMDKQTGGSTIAADSVSAYSAPVPPHRPVYTPSNPAIMQRAFDSIVERGLQRVEKRENFAQRPAMQPAFAGKNSLFLQRKADNLPPTNTLVAIANSGGGETPYNNIVNAIDLYHNDERTSPSNYGNQLYKLDNIRNKIALWQRAKQAEKASYLKSAVNFGTSIFSDENAREAMVASLPRRVNAEERAVQGQGKSQWQENHKRDVASLWQWLKEGFMSGDRRLQNSCEWLMSGAARLYAVTTTGDSEQRVRVAQKNPHTHTAYTPAGQKGSPGAVTDPDEVTYDEHDLANNTNVFMDPDGAGGWRDEGVVAITDASKKSREVAWATFVHEVQHEADKHRGRDSRAGVAQASQQHVNTINDEDREVIEQQFQAELMLTKYKTEYRAHYYMGKHRDKNYAAMDDSSQSVVRDGYRFSPRQLAIFEDILLYPHTRIGWNTVPIAEKRKAAKAEKEGIAYTPRPGLMLADGRSFRQAVSDYWHPDTEGMNKYNSLAVNRFVDALDAIDPERDRMAAERKEKEQKGELILDPFTLITEYEQGDIEPVARTETNADAPAVRALLRTIEELSAEDARAIVNEQPALMRKIGKHLGGAALEVVRNRLNLRMGQLVVL